MSEQKTGGSQNPFLGASSRLLRNLHFHMYSLFRRCTVNLMPFQHAVLLKGRTSMLFLSWLSLHLTETLSKQKGKVERVVLPSHDSFSTSCLQHLSWPTLRAFSEQHLNNIKRFSLVAWRVNEFFFC